MDDVKEKLGCLFVLLVIGFVVYYSWTHGTKTERTTIAMVGEAGAEAVMPLENNTGWIDDLASKLNGSSGAPVNLTVQIGTETIIDTVVDLINDKTAMSGRNVITT